MYNEGTHAQLRDELNLIDAQVTSCRSRKRAPSYLRVLMLGKAEEKRVS